MNASVAGTNVPLDGKTPSAAAVVGLRSGGDTRGVLPTCPPSTSSNGMLLYLRYSGPDNRRIAHYLLRMARKSNHTNRYLRTSRTRHSVPVVRGEQLYSSAASSGRGNSFTLLNVKSGDVEVFTPKKAALLHYLVLYGTGIYIRV